MVIGGDVAAIHRAKAHLLFQDGIDLVASLAAFEEAIAASPSVDINDLLNKGDLLRRLNLKQEALEWVNSCLLSHGDLAGLVNLKGCILQDLGMLADASTLYRMAVQADPNNPLYYANLGFVLCDLGTHQQAIDTVNQALPIAPSHGSLHHCMAQANFHLGKPTISYHHYKKAIEALPTDLNIWDNFLYFLSFVHTLPAEKLINHCRDYAEKALFPRVANALPAFSHNWQAPAQRPLRIGIISAEVGSHSVGFFLLSLVLGASPDQAEFYVFPTKDRSAEPRWQIFKDNSHHFEPIVQMSDLEACAKIRELNLDVVLETSQHMAANRLTIMAHRVAPVQCHYIGMHGTTAVPAVDYFIGDDWITPDSFASHFTERFLRLARTWVCYTPPEELPPIKLCTDDAPLRLGSFNNVSKISHACLRLWAQLMLAIPDSTLLIKDSLRNGEIDHQRNLIDYLQRRGVAPSRVMIMPRTPSWETHMDLYNKLDIALDTLPLASGTTAFDALLMGVPLVAYCGNWIGGRLSASIVHGFGQPDWIVSTTDDYLAVVRRLAADLPALRAGKAARREQFLSSELCDRAGLATSVLEVLRSAYLAAKPD